MSNGAKIETNLVFLIVMLANCADEACHPHHLSCTETYPLHLAPSLLPIAMLQVSMGGHTKTPAASTCFTTAPFQPCGTQRAQDGGKGGLGAEPRARPSRLTIFPQFRNDLVFLRLLGDRSGVIGLVIFFSVATIRLIRLTGGKYRALASQVSFPLKTCR